MNLFFKKASAATVVRELTFWVTTLTDETRSSLDRKGPDLYVSTFVFLDASNGTVNPPRYALSHVCTVCMYIAIMNEGSGGGGRDLTRRIDVGVPRTKNAYFCNSVPHCWFCEIVKHLTFQRYACTSINQPPNERITMVALSKRHDSR